MHGCTGQLSPHTLLLSQTYTHTHKHALTHIYIYTFIHPANAYTLLLGLAEVVAEVVVARWFGYDRRAVGDRDVLEVQEAELDLHRKEDLQLTAHGFTTHLPAQEDAESICPQAELMKREKGSL